MSNTRTYEELKQRLDAMADEMHGRKSEPNAAAKKQIAAYNSAFWDTMHTGMPNNELKVGSDGADALAVAPNVANLTPAGGHGVICTLAAAGGDEHPVLRDGSDRVHLQLMNGNFSHGKPPEMG